MEEAFGALVSMFIATNVLHLQPAMAVPFTLAFSAVFRRAMASPAVRAWFHRRLRHFLPRIPAYLAVTPFANRRHNPYFTSLQANLIRNHAPEFSCLEVSPQGMVITPASLEECPLQVSYKGHLIDVTTAATSSHTYHLKEGSERYMQDVVGNSTDTELRLASTTAPHGVLRDFVTWVHAQEVQGNTQGLITTYTADIKCRGCFSKWKPTLGTTVKREDNVVVNPALRAAFFGRLHDFKAQCDAKVGGAALLHPTTWTCLLHGPHGTGKTSMAKAAAASLGMPVFFFPSTATAEAYQALIADLNDFTMGASAQAHLVVLDDVCRMLAEAPAGVEANDLVEGESPASGLGLPLAALFAMLDGLPEARNRVVIMTANDIGVLRDYPGMTRPGRIDSVLEVPLMGAWEVEAAFDLCCPGHGQGAVLASLPPQPAIAGCEVFALLKAKPPEEAAAAILRKCHPLGMPR